MPKATRREAIAYMGTTVLVLARSVVHAEAGPDEHFVMHIHKRGPKGRELVGSFKLPPELVEVLAKSDDGKPVNVRIEHHGAQVRLVGEAPIADVHNVKAAFRRIPSPRKVQ